MNKLTPLTALNKYFGLNEFRESQLEIINSILAGENVLAVLPTGAGKSICYQIPALISAGTSIVISPLIALMQDQVQSLNQRHEIAAFINSTLDYRSEEKVLRKINENKIKLLYVSPEKLESSAFVQKLKSASITYLFIDEAHCISEWGMDFRPSYRKIINFAENLEIKRISSFTATATPDVRQDILNQLKQTDSKVFVKGFKRDNIKISVTQSYDKKPKLYELIKKYSEPTIVYTSTRKNAEEVYQYLASNKMKAAYYHAGLAAGTRKIIQDDFISGNIDIICATNAFGMGIDKSNIRLVVHYNMPSSIENYYQEIGRAGRDGKPSYAHLFYEGRDREIQEYLINNNTPSPTSIKLVYSLIHDFAQTASGQIIPKPIPIDRNLTAFLKLKGINENQLHSIIKVLSFSDYFKLINANSSKPSIKYLLSPNELKSYLKRIAQKYDRDILLALIKKFGNNVFDKTIDFSINSLSKSLNISAKIINETLDRLNSLGVVEFIKISSDQKLQSLQPRVKMDALRIDYSLIKKRHDHQIRKLNDIVDLVYTDECRTNFILKYFGERVNSNCGNCDNCDSHKSMKNVDEYLEEIIVKALQNNRRGFRLTVLINILRGTASDKNFKLLPSYGVCKHFSINELKEAMNHLIAGGKLKQFDSYVTIAEVENDDSIRNDGEIQKTITEGYEATLELFNLLRIVRKKAAHKFNQTEHLICSDEVLRNITEKKPKSISDLQLVTGVNQRFISKTGEEIIEAVNEFTAKRKTVNRLIPKEFTSIYNLVCKNYSLEEIASMLKVSETIVSVQIENLLTFDPEISIDKLIKRDNIKLIKEKLDLGFTGLKELKKELPKELSYAMIRIVLAKFRRASF